MAAQALDRVIAVQDTRSNGMSDKDRSFKGTNTRTGVLLGARQLLTAANTGMAE